MNGEHRKRKRSPSMVAGEYHREKRASTSKVKETVEQAQFREFVSRVHAVLEE